MTTKPKIKAISPWYGSKRILAPRIVELLGEHKMYYEPFCGSMAVLLAKPKTNFETVCDLHGDLINLAEVIANPDLAGHLYDWLDRTLFSEGIFQNALEYLHNLSDCPDELEWAYHFFIHSWVGRSGESGSKHMTSAIANRWTPTGGSATTRFRSATESIPWWHERLKNVVILNRSAWDVIPKIPDRPGVSIYCDPPYLKETRGSDYRHDFDSMNHAKLAELLNVYQHTKIVVSYYAHPLLESIYPLDRWEHIDASMNKNLDVQHKRGSKPSKAPEVLIVRRLNKT